MVNRKRNRYILVMQISKSTWYLLSNNYIIAENNYLVADNQNFYIC